MNRGFYSDADDGLVQREPGAAAGHRRFDRGAGDFDGRQPGRFSAEVHAWANSPRCNRCWSSGYFDPRTRVIIAVTVNGSMEVLMDGIITKQDITPDSKPGKSMLDRHRASI